MKLEEISKIFDYNYWATERLLAAASKLTQDQFSAPSAFPKGGVRGTLVHTLDTELAWRMRIQFNSDSDVMDEKHFPTRDFLAQKWNEEKASMRAFLAGLKDEDLESIIRYSTSGGIQRERVLWHCLFHVVNHGTQHRSEAAVMLTDFGQSPGDIDFPLFLNENK